MCGTCRCSPDAACSTSALNKPAGCPSCSASGTSTASESSPGTGQTSPSRPTCVTCTTDAPISSSEGSPASPCPMPVSVRLRLTIGGCGPRWQESFAHYDPASSLWRTSQGSLLPGSGTSSVIWPKRGMTRSGSAFELPTQGHLTNASGCSSSPLLPTPTTQDGANTGGPSQYDRNSLPLNTLVTTLLPTPAAHEPGGTPEQHLWRKNRLDGGNRVTPTHLSLAVQLLPTPSASGDARNTGITSDYFTLAGEIARLRGATTSLPSEDGNTSSAQPHRPPMSEDD